jgi:uncharacterized membrane protein YphA (DoxX/SURF4 family)
MAAGNAGARAATTRSLWIAQGLLTIIFLVAGGSKLVMSVEAMNSAAKLPLPGLFLRFIGVCEVLGAIGLILPGLLHIRPDLTPLAAAGLAVITIGATVITLMGGDVALALIPLAVSLLAAFVAYRHWHRGATRSRTL